MNSESTMDDAATGSDHAQPLQAKPSDTCAPRSSAEQVPLGERVAWGFGGWADNYFMSIINSLLTPIYTIALKLDPFLAGIALLIPRLLDAVTDPLMGNLSDNTRSRWGRRRPYIMIGVVLTALIMPFLWMPPSNTDWGMFIYFCCMASLYSITYTVFVVPYTALGYELTNDYDERTEVLAWRAYLGLIGGLGIPWIPKMAVRLGEWMGGGDAVGARWLCVGIGVMCVIIGAIPAIFCKEKLEIQKQEKINIRSALQLTMHNRSFLILFIAYVVVVSALFTSGSFAVFVNVYYVCEGNREFAYALGGWSGMLLFAMAYAGLFSARWLSEIFDKRTTALVGFGLTFLAVLSLWFTMTPKMPYLQLVSSALTGLGLQGSWLMITSMTADVCDEDELISGLRREGMYGAVMGFAQKFAFALTAVLAGGLTKLAGYVPEVDPGPDVIFRLRLLLIGIQGLGLLFTFILLCFYPITRERSEVTRRQLEARHAALNKTNDL